MEKLKSPFIQRPSFNPDVFVPGHFITVKKKFEPDHNGFITESKPHAIKYVHFKKDLLDGVAYETLTIERLTSENIQVEVRKP